MDIPKYLESRGWVRAGAEWRRKWQRGPYYDFEDREENGVIILLCGYRVFEGILLSEEFADQLMVALGITSQDTLRQELGTFDIDTTPEELQKMREE